MDITITKDELTKALNATQSIVDRKTTNPMLLNLLLSVGDGELKISSSDLEITAVSKCPVEVRKSGSIAVNARVFSDLVKELPDSSINIILGEANRIDLLADSARSNMIGFSPDEFPALPGIHLEPKNKFSAAALSSMIASTIYAVSQDETRFNLNGVCFSSEKSGAENQLKMAATDGHRLAIVTRPSGKLSVEGSVIVPRKGLAEAKRLVEDLGNADIGIGIEEGFFILNTGRSKIAMRLVDGEFPDYTQVIPKDKGVRATVSSKELAQALRLVSVMSTDKNKCVRLDFSPGSLRLSASSSELGDASEVLEVDYEGEAVSIGFNSRYLHDFTASLGEDQRMCIEIHGATGPGRFFSESDESYFGIVMPMRIV